MNKTSFELLTVEDDHEEAHYEHTMRDVIDLMVVYGFDVVMDDIKDRLEGITIK